MKPPLHEYRIGVDLDRGTLPADERSFLERLDGPSLIRLAGRDPSRVRIVSTLLHANEPSGLRAVLRYLRSDAQPATDVLFFVAAVRTALCDPFMSHRALPGETDANRCWLPPWSSPQGEVAKDVLGHIFEATPECLVDIHNNTGHNPAYGVAFQVGPAEQGIVSLFADRIVHTPIQLGTIVEATVPRFPSVTVECGRAGDAIADQVAWAGLQKYLDRDQLDFNGSRHPLLHLEDPVRVCLHHGVDLAFGDAADPIASFTVSSDIDRHNFEHLPAGSRIGWVHDGAQWPIEAFGHDGTECSREYFEVASGVLQTRCDFIPIMMTTSRVIAKSDCLFYAVQDADRETARPTSTNREAEGAN